MILAWDQSQISWEQDGLEADLQVDSRFASTKCDGPLCRSQVPSPFQSGPSSNIVMISLPWRCTGEWMSWEQTLLNESLPADVAALIPSPDRDQIIKPPRFFA